MKRVKEQKEILHKKMVQEDEVLKNLKYTFW